MIRSSIFIKPHYRNKVCVVCGMFKNYSRLSWIIVVVRCFIAI